MAFAVSISEHRLALVVAHVWVSASNHAFLLWKHVHKRKNFMFVGSERAGRAAANFFNVW